MKFAAILLSGLAIAALDATPRGGTFNPKGLAEERTFPAPNAWLFSAGGRFIATEIDESAFGLIDTATGRDFGQLGKHPRARHDGNFGQSDRVLATTGNNGDVKVFDALSRKELLSLAQPHPSYACSVSVSADGRKLATGGGTDGTAKVFDIATGKELHSFVLGTGNIPSIEFDATGTHIVASGPGSALQAIRLNTGAVTPLGDFGWIPEYRFSPNGRFLAAGIPSGLVIWDALTWKELRRIPMRNVPGVSRHLAFSRDSRLVAAVDHEGKIRFWDPSTGALVHTLGEGLQPDGPIEFTPDGRVIALNDEGGTVHVFGPKAASVARPAGGRK
jgi:WD40 repeat protein